MDTLAHGLWTYALYRRKPNIQLTKSIIWGTVPDISLLVGEVYSLVHTHAITTSIYSSSVFYNLYAFTHSLVIFTALFLIYRILVKKWSLEMTAWLLHILIDMIGHIHNLTPFLYPMSKVTMPPLFGWENTSMIIANYSILFFILIVLPRLKKTKTLAK